MVGRTRLTLTIATRQSRRYRLGPGVERPVGRVVAVLLLVLLLAVLPVASLLAGLAPSEQAQHLAHLDPRRQFFGDSTQDFLPTPVVALPPDAHAGPPVPAAVEAAGAPIADQVKVANTGGVGILLRADPAGGQLVASLKDGQVLTVLEHQTVAGAEWLHVRTQDGAEGWVFARLVGPAQ